MLSSGAFGLFFPWPFPLRQSHGLGATLVTPLIKLDVVGPVDNRPSMDKLHHFVKNKNKQKITCDM